MLENKQIYIIRVMFNLIILAPNRSKINLFLEGAILGPAVADQVRHRLDHRRPASTAVVPRYRIKSGTGLTAVVPRLDRGIQSLFKPENQVFPSQTELHPAVSWHFPVPNGLSREYLLSRLLSTVIPLHRRRSAVPDQVRHRLDCAGPSKSLK